MSVVAYSDNVMLWLNKPSFACVTHTDRQLKANAMATVRLLLLLSIGSVHLCKQKRSANTS